MGRPLSKKYFGNRNIGRNGREGWVNDNDYNPNNAAETNTNFPDGDDGIGGEGVASYGTIVAGSGWTTNPDPYFNNPSLPGGVPVEGIVHYKALSFATTANGTGYKVADVLEVNTGTATTKARAPVAAITVVGTPVIADGGINYDSGNGTNGDEVTFTHAHLTTGLTVRITSDDTGLATGIAVVTPGIWNGSGTPPTTMADGVNGFTATLTHQFTDGNGAGLQLSGIQWGVYSFGTVSVAGDYTVFPDTAGSLGAVTGAGMNATATITMGLLSVHVTEQGSGYISPADAALNFDNGAHGASAVAVLTTDSGLVGTAGNQENAIIAYVWQDGQRRIADIVKQTGSHRYIFIASDNGDKEDETVKGYLKNGQASANFEADITAFDTAGYEYWVTRITARRAVIHRKNASHGQFADPTSHPNGQSVPWTMNGTSGTKVRSEQQYWAAGVNVKIENA